MRARVLVAGIGSLLVLAHVEAQTDPGEPGEAPLRLESSFQAPYAEECGAPCDFTADLYGNTLAVSRYTLDAPAGVIALFTRSDSQWTQSALLQNPCPPPPDGSDGSDPVPCWNPELGRALTLSGNYLFASLEDAELLEPAPAAVVIYRRRHDEWREQQRVALPAPKGWELTYARIQQIAAHESSVAVSVLYHGRLDGVEQQLEAVFVLERMPWDKRYRIRARLAADEPSSSFGAALALERDTLVVGAPGEAASAGAVYIYRQHGRKWRRIQKLQTGSSHEQGFGESVALSGHTLAIGAPRDLDSETLQAGFVYVYRNFGKRWFEQARLEDPVTISEPSGFTIRFFGTQVALKHDTLVVGANAAFPRYDYEYPLGFVFERRRGAWTTIADFMPNPGVVRLELSARTIMAVVFNLRFGDNTYLYELPPRSQPDRHH